MKARELARGVLGPFSRALRGGLGALRRSAPTEILPRFLPYQPERDVVVIDAETLAETEGVHQGLPVPPRSLHAGYGTDTDHYLRCGEEDHAALLEGLARTGFTPTGGDRILELGCAAGRMLRNLREHAETSEVWGADLSAEAILWCQRHLSPPFKFTTCTTAPHLPFEDNYFSLIYAPSVFTHIFDQWDAWLLELRRILRPGGRVWATVLDETSYELARQEDHWARSLRWELERAEARHPGIRGFEFFVAKRLTLDPLVFCTRDFVRTRWGQFFTIKTIEPEGHVYQTVVIMAKEPGSGA